MSGSGGFEGEYSLDAPDLVRLAGEPTSAGGPASSQAVGVLVRRLQHAHELAWAAHVDATLSGLEYTVLGAVRDHAGVEQGTLARLVSLQRSTMADVGRRLQHRGLISRRTNPQDARSKLVELTARGWETLRAADDRVPALAAALLGDDEDPSSLLRRLEDLADRWDLLTPPADAGPGGGIVTRS